MAIQLFVAILILYETDHRKPVSLVARAMNGPCSSSLTRYALLSALLLAMGNGPATWGQTAPGQKWAILIGINDYYHAQDLQYCSSDQQALRDRLIQADFSPQRIFLLHDDAKEGRYKPTKRNIERQLEAVLKLVEKGDMVLLAFSGHGLHVAGESYLCPIDGELEKPDSLIATDTIYEMLKDCPASLKVMLVDACRNDPYLGGRRSMAATPSSRALARSFQQSTPEGIVLLNSCAPGEISWEEQEFGHGVFMYYVLDALKGAGDRNGDNKVSLSELARYANDKTKLYVLNKFSKTQRPFITNESTLDALDFGLPYRLSGPAEEITNSLGMKLRLIPAGEFMMGNAESAQATTKRFEKYDAQRSWFNVEQPRHRVQITKPFYMGMHEVTVGQFRRFVADSNYKTKAEIGDGAYGWNAEKEIFELNASYNWRTPGFSQGDDHPVTCVSWNDAVAFCQWLSRQDGREYRLPTEAEWEYACRAGTTTQFYHGNDPEGLARVGNVADGTAKAKFENWTWAINARDGYSFTAPAGRFQKNAFGLYDMHGNVYEWCQDWYGGDYYEKSPSTDPAGPDSGSSRVLRGGSWGDNPFDVRSTNRYGNTPGIRFSLFGFRVVCASE